MLMGEWDTLYDITSRIHLSHSHITKCGTIDELRILAFLGINIDSSDEDEDENANDSIRVNCDFDSNEIYESEEQNEKYFDARISIEAGVVRFDEFEKLRTNEQLLTRIAPFGTSSRLEIRCVRLQILKGCTFHGLAL
jgi:hypothetical protein